MIRHQDPETKLETLKLLLYLVPIFGFFPALWSLYARQGSRRENTVSKTAVTLALIWVAAYGLSSAGAQGTDLMSARLVVTGLLGTTGYFITNFWLMIRLLRGSSVRLPGVGTLSDRLP